MYHIIELESQAEILFAHTYETRHYDLSFAPQEDYIEISYIEREKQVVLRRGWSYADALAGYSGSAFAQGGRAVLQLWNRFTGTGRLERV